MKEQVIFKGTPKEAAVIKAALEHYAVAIECAYVGVESVAPRPLVPDGEPLEPRRIAKQLIRDMS